MENEKNDNIQNEDNPSSTPNFSADLEEEKNKLEAEKFAQKQEQYKQILQPPQNIDFEDQNPYIWRIGFGRRLGAYIIDNVFVFLLLIVMAMFTGVAEAMADMFGSDLSVFTNPAKVDEVTLFITKSIIPLSLAVTFLYYSLEVIFAQSLGKMLLGMQIGDANKKFATYSKLLYRLALKLGSSVLLLFTLVTSLELFSSISSLWSFIIFVGCFFVLGAKKQALHDSISGTAVYFKDELQQLNINSVER